MKEKYILASKIAKTIGAIVVGNPDAKIYGISLYKDSDDRMFTYYDGEGSVESVVSHPFAAMLVKTSFLLPLDKTYIVTTSEVHSALYLIVELMIQEGLYTSYQVLQDSIIKNVSLGQFVEVGEGTIIGEGCIIGNYSTIGNHVQMGNNCLIGNHVSIEDNVRIGNNVTIQSGTIIGGSSFEFSLVNGEYKKIPNVGSVVIRDNVSIGSNVTIDRGTIGITTIGKGTIIDNLVQIAHEVQIGERCKICAQCGIAGWSTIENGVTLYGKVGVNNKVTIGEGATVLALSGVTKNIKPYQVVSGYPASSHMELMRFQSFLRKLYRKKEE